MKVLLQRVLKASVSIDGQTVGSINQGLLLLVGLGQEDNSATLNPMVQKLINMRIFSDQQSKFNLSLLDVAGEVLLVPQFTLFADTHKGRRPEFFGALEPKKAEPLFLEFAELFKQAGVKRVETGKFGAHMLVSLENDGPVTIIIDSKARE